MRARIWRSMRWSGFQKKDGWVLFEVYAWRGKWKVAGAQLYTYEREYVGYWFVTSMPRDLISEVQKRVMKVFGRPEGGQDRILGPKEW